jgi:enoyl-CoA hydratase
MPDFVKYEIREHVGIITLARPEKLNAINDDMADELNEAGFAALADEAARVILFRAEGRAFCAGRDTSQLGHRRSAESDFHHVLRAQQRNLAMMESAKPVVAAINGHAIGGGFEIALAADIRIAAEDAVMRVPEIQYGLLPDTGASQILSSLIGPSKTKLLILTGRAMNAAQALAWGAVDVVVPRAELDEEAFAIARDMAARPPIALAMGKRLANHLWASRIREGFGLELLSQTALFRTDDYAEARAALRDKRPPAFKGS